MPLKRIRYSMDTRIPQFPIMAKVVAAFVNHQVIVNILQGDMMVHATL